MNADVIHRLRRVNREIRCKSAIVRRNPAGMLATVMRVFMMMVLMLAAGVAAVSAQSAKVLKVLPHFLDQEGRHTLSPSLFERDAYQFHLRNHREECSTLRYDVQWNSTYPRDAKLVICLELIGSDAFRDAPLRIEETVSKRGFKSRWTALSLSDEQFAEIGKVLAWRVTVWNGTDRVAERKSFLWVRESYVPPTPEEEPRG